MVIGLSLSLPRLALRTDVCVCRGERHKRRVIEAPDTDTRPSPASPRRPGRPADTTPSEVGQTGRRRARPRLTP